MDDIRAGLRRCTERAYQAISELADPVEGYRQATEMQSDLRQASERPALKLRAVMARRVEAAGYPGSTAVGRVLGLSKQRAQQLLQLADREDVPAADVAPVIAPKQIRTRRIPEIDHAGSTFEEDSLKLGAMPDAPLSRAELLIPPREISKLLGIGARERVLIRERKMYQNDQPSQLASSYIPEKYAGGTELAYPDTGPRGIYERLAERGHEVTRFREETEVLHPGQTEMAFLGLGPADFVVELTRFSYDRNGTVLEVTVNAFPADGIRLVYEWSAS